MQSALGVCKLDGRLEEELVAAVRARAVWLGDEAVGLVPDEAVFSRVVRAIGDHLALGAFVEVVPCRVVPSEEGREEHGRKKEK